MGTLLFIRHAETDMTGRLCGHSDPPVNARGLHQIAALVKALEQEPIDAIYTSDLARATATADALGAAFQLAPVPMPALREIDFGEWEGLNWIEIEGRDPQYARRWSDAYPELPAPGGESIESFHARVLAAAESLSARSTQGITAVVTHAGVMQVVLRILGGLEVDEAWRKTRGYCCQWRYEADEFHRHAT